jgi:hypothetical protein
MTVMLSPSSLNLLKDCPRCFWIHFNKGIKRPNGAFPSLPSGMDRILKNHFDSFRDRGILPPVLQKLKDVKLFDDVKLLEIWRNNRKGIEWVDDNGNVLKGAVDNILQKGEKLIVLDFKTRGFPLQDDTHEHYQDQLNIYNFLLRKNGFETEDYAYLLFYHPKEVEEDGDVAFHTDLIKVNISTDNAEKLFDEAIEILKGEMPDFNEECEFCKWRNEE